MSEGSSENDVDIIPIIPVNVGGLGNLGGGNEHTEKPPTKPVQNGPLIQRPPPTAQEPHLPVGKPQEPSSPSGETSSSGDTDVVLIVPIVNVVDLDDLGVPTNVGNLLTESGGDEPTGKPPTQPVQNGQPLNPPPPAHGPSLPMGEPLTNPASLPGEASTSIDTDVPSNDPVDTVGPDEGQGSVDKSTLPPLQDSPPEEPATAPEDPRPPKDHPVKDPSTSLSDIDVVPDVPINVGSLEEPDVKPPVKSPPSQPLPEPPAAGEVDPELKNELVPGTPKSVNPPVMPTPGRHQPLQT